MKRAALGFRTHTGWAAMVALARTNHSPLPIILDRRRIEMIPSGEREVPRFVYHAAAKLKPEAAERFIRQAERDAIERAEAELGKAIQDLRSNGYQVVATGIVGGNRPLSSSLEAILGAHTLIHAAEGELFRQAIARASESLQLAVLSVRERQLDAETAKRFQVSAEVARQRLEEIGRAAGRPWALDQRQACMAALLALGK
jgi:hypothetical protein